MTMTPNRLGVFSKLYGSNDAMDFGKAALVAVVGFITVIVVLAVIALFIKAIAFIFDKTDKKTATLTKADQSDSLSSAARSAQPSVELVDVDERTAAVIMAIVSHESGISPERLAFKSIKLLEDK